MARLHSDFQRRDHWFFQIRLPQWFSRSIERVPLFWRFQVLGWVAFGVLTIPLKMSAYGSFWYAIGITLFREPVGFMITCGLRQIYRRMNFGSDRPVRLAVCVVSLGLLGGGLDALLMWLSRPLVEMDQTAQGTFGIFCFRSMLFCCWSVLYFSVRDQIATSKHLLNLARAKAAAQDAELLMLRAQVAPHFLFNSLNTILAGLERQPLSLAPVVQGLADYFRFSLTNRHDLLIPLGDEFDAIVNYLKVEKARFRDSIWIETHINASVRSLAVPGVFLQPLVENALKYGHQTSPTPLLLKVRATAVEDGGAVVEVMNSGCWIEPPPMRLADDPGGNGLDILRRRLELLYRGEAMIKISSESEPDRVTVQVRIPPPESTH
jgi:two-component system, LytTR family, sensor kinase